MGSPARPWSIPEADLLRQATASLRGYVYQLHQSAAAWIDLPEGNTLQIEVAEDFSEILKQPDQIDEILKATQVKDTRESGRITLNSGDVLDTIESVHRLGQANPGRIVDIVFLTTSEIGKERKNPLPSGDRGLDAWRKAAAGGPVAEISKALVARLPKGPARTFVRKSNAATLREQLLARLTFECGAPDWQLIASSNRTKLSAMCEEVQATPAAAHAAYDVVFGELLTTILTSSTRQLTRTHLINCLRRATAIAMPSQIVEQLAIAGAALRPEAAIDPVALRMIASAMLEVAEPPSLAALVGDDRVGGRTAFDQIAALERTLTRSNPSQKDGDRATINTLAGLMGKRHMVIGGPGSGKSHALWRSARQLLDKQEVFPLFLSAAELSTSDELFAPLTYAAAGLSIEAIVSDPRVCFMIDGWSEFASGDKAGERHKALTRLRNARIIATAKSAEGAGAAFEVWTLDLFTPEQVAASTGVAHPGRPVLSQAIIDLLRLPLLLSIYLLTDADAFSTGELLRQFHDQLARDLPGRFTDALARAAAASVLTDDRGFGRFIAQLEAHAGSAGITESKQLLRRLGTITERNGKALPIHDLYWNWLAGRGLLRHFSSSDALRSIATRECYALALQSGDVAAAEDGRAIVDSDIVLSATLETGRPIGAVDPMIGGAIDRGLGDASLARRSRAGLAALAINKPDYLGPALDVLSEVYEARLALPEWSAALHPELLYPHRSILASWMPARGTELVLGIIADHGGPEWSDWLGQLAVNNTVSGAAALAAALGCRPDFPEWGHPYFDELVRAAPWLLRSAAGRRANRALARHIAATYDHLVDTAVKPGSSGWLELNRVLVDCGDNAVFAALLERFPAMSEQAQEYLGFAVVERGEPWIGAFQKIAFTSFKIHHHRLTKYLSPDIDDETARAWIANGHATTGWRVLVARHGNALLPELLAGLPQSYSGMPDVPALEPLRFLEDAPASLIETLWSRIGGVMLPKTMDQLLEATAAIYPQGVAHIVGFVCQQPNALPAYHLHRTVALYRDWRNRLGTRLDVEAEGSGPVEFDRWISTFSATSRWDPNFTPEMLSALPEAAVALVLTTFQHDDAKAEAVLRALKDVKAYNKPLLDRMLSTARLATLIPAVFADAFGTFPSSALGQCLEHPDIDQGQLIFRLGATSNPLHRDVHLALIRRVLSEPIDVHHYRYVAAMMRAYQRFEVRDMLGDIGDQGGDDRVWLIREIETARGERLIDEQGLPLAS